MDGKRKSDSEERASKKNNQHNNKKKKKLPLVLPVVPAVSSSSTRRELISGYHNTLKKVEQQATDHQTSLNTITDHKELHELGGLQRYQEASLVGQNSGYHYNTAKWVVKMLKQYNIRAPADTPWLDVLAIDLNPCHPSVVKQDFLEMNTERHFDVVVLSLVVNFVGTPSKRGEMLKRSAEMLYEGGHLFLVLPKACVVNSRYMDDELLIEMISSFNMQLVHNKHSSKLAFYIFKRNHGAIIFAGHFMKQLRHAGSTRNGFCIEINHR